MSAFMCLAVAAVVAPQPSPLDVKAVQADMRMALDQFQKAFKAHMNAGKDTPFQADLPALTAPMRAKAKAAKGVQREAWHVGLLALYVGVQGPKDEVATLLKQIPASSPGWAVAPEAVSRLGSILGEEGVAYIREVETRGCPSVRAARLADGLKPLLMQGKEQEAGQVVKTLQRDFPQEEVTAKAVKLYDTEVRLGLGKEAPDFHIANLDNPEEVFTKASFKGKYLLIDFWGTWCGWCIQDLPTTHKVFETYKDRLQVLSLAADKGPEAVQAFRKRPGYPMPWKHGLLTPATNIDKVFNVTGFATLYLLDPEGRIVAKGMDLRLEQFEPTMTRILGR